MAHAKGHLGSPKSLIQNEWPLKDRTLTPKRICTVVDNDSNRLSCKELAVRLRDCGSACPARTLSIGSIGSTDYPQKWTPSGDTAAKKLWTRMVSILKDTRGAA